MKGVPPSASKISWRACVTSFCLVISSIVSVGLKMHAAGAHGVVMSQSVMVGTTIGGPFGSPLPGSSGSSGSTGSPGGFGDSSQEFQAHVPSASTKTSQPC